MRARLLAVPLGLAATLSPAQDQRASLLSEPAWLEEPMRPRFVEMGPDELGNALQVIAARNSAETDFNAPEIQLHLPLADNSTYAEVRLEEPRLIGIDGRRVPFEAARPPHDVRTQIARIRLLPAQGEGPVEFARATGEVTVRYPLAVETRTVAAGRTDAVARIDGPYVEIVEDVLAEAPSLSPLEPVRAYDAGGHQLQTAPFSAMRRREGRTLRRIAFRGEVARVEVDRVVRAAEVTVRYDVPIAEALSKLRFGLPPENERAVFPHPSTRLTVSVRSTEAEIPLPDPIPTPQPTPPPPEAPAPETAADPTAAMRSGPPVEIRDRSILSAGARGLADALEALEGALGEPVALVRLVAYPPTMVTLSVDQGESGLASWTWRNGEVFGPRDLDVSGLECPAPLPPAALTLARLPSLTDDAALRAGSGQEAARILVGQDPCGAPRIRVTLRDGTGVVYTGDGIFSAVEAE